jgi:hypothetical protein
MQDAQILIIQHIGLDAAKMAMERTHGRGAIV